MNDSNAVSRLASHPASSRCDEGRTPEVAAAIHARDANANRHLAWMLRRSLDGSRGNLKIREQLEELARDADRVQVLARSLGARHALLRDLSRLVGPTVSSSRT